jgi:hypothetical protein
VKVNELINESTTNIVLLKLKTDNPGGKWLDEKRAISTEDGLNEYGAPSRFGTVTAVWNRNVLVPISVVSHLKGVHGEHYRTRLDTLNWLNDYMGKNHRFPPFRPDEDEQYFPFITVYQDGTPYISEGNHRIKSAKELGWKYIPIELRYFNGAELEDGLLSPAKVREYDQAALELGYSPLKNAFAANV